MCTLHLLHTVHTASLIPIITLFSCLLDVVSTNKWWRCIYACWGKVRVCCANIVKVRHTSCTSSSKRIITLLRLLNDIVSTYRDWKVAFKACLMINHYHIRGRVSCSTCIEIIWTLIHSSIQGLSYHLTCYSVCFLNTNCVWISCWGIKVHFEKRYQPLRYIHLNNTLVHWINSFYTAVGGRVSIPIIKNLNWIDNWFDFIGWRRSIVTFD